jgi:hypothetical protein
VSTRFLVDARLGIGWHPGRLAWGSGMPRPARAVTLSYLLRARGLSIGLVAATGFLLASAALGRALGVNRRWKGTPDRRAKGALPHF